MRKGIKKGAEKVFKWNQEDSKPGASPSANITTSIDPEHAISKDNSQVLSIRLSHNTDPHAYETAQDLASHPPGVGFAGDNITINNQETAPSEPDIPDPDAVDAGRQAASNDLSQLNLVNDRISSFLNVLLRFNKVAEGIASINPYAKAAWAILSFALQEIPRQAELDDSVLSLVVKMNETYTFLISEGVKQIEGMETVVRRISQQTLECAYFIQAYSKNKHFWLRLLKNSFSEATKRVQSYNETFDNLLQKFRDEAARDTSLVVHRVWHEVESLADKMDLNSIPYADGAGLNTEKLCLLGTRGELLDEIIKWANNINGDAPRVFWLHGTAGSGKSSIAHTIANHFKQLKRLGSCFCFARDRVADRRHEKIFTTIARDLADRDTQLLGQLSAVVRDDLSLLRTPDILQHWEKLIVEPAKALSEGMVGPIVIVIDALDESGDTDSRRRLLRILAENVANLPPHIRIFLTSRPLDDIHNTFNGVPHIQQKSMDDIPQDSTERDILNFVSGQLPAVIKGPDQEALARASGGLFEWARIACAHVRGDNNFGTGLLPIERLKAIMPLDEAKHDLLLDGMYKFTLKSIFPAGPSSSVMAQMLGTMEPLSIDSLGTMRSQFVDGEEISADVFRAVMASMGTLLKGTTDRYATIRPLHSSFSDFLTDRGRSEEFFIDVPSIHNNLAMACLGVMKDELRFDMCQFPSSYLLNSEVHDLKERVEKSILPALGYSSRFWTRHLSLVPFSSRLGGAVREFFNNEHLLYWFEALSLLGFINTCAVALSSVVEWFMLHGEYKDVLDDAADAQQFIRVFGGPISMSVPHLYLSALALSPTNSRIARKFTDKFHGFPKITSPLNVSWPVMQGVIAGHQGPIQFVAFSPDGKRIVSGSGDRAIRFWDAETGKPLQPPLKGHHRRVESVAFLPDGRYVVSGSGDKTIRLWDAETGKALQPPLEGHDGTVKSVAFSPDGRRVVSGSDDKTIRLWDAETGKALQPPLEGHDSWVLSVAFSPDGRHVVSGLGDKTIRLWDAETGKALQPPLEGHDGSVSSVAFSPDGRRVVSGSGDSTIRLWDAETGKALQPPLEGHDGLVSGDQTIQSTSKHSREPSPLSRIRKGIKKGVEKVLKRNSGDSNPGASSAATNIDPEHAISKENSQVPFIRLSHNTDPPAYETAQHLATYPSDVGPAGGSITINVPAGDIPKSQETASSQPDIPDPDAVDAARQAASTGLSQLNQVDNRISSFLDALSKFNKVAEQIASINPYAQAAWTILSFALQKITEQAELDDSVLSLVVKMNDTYTFLISEGMEQIKGMETVVRRISQQTQECAYFIQAYSKNKHFWLRLLKNSFSEATERVQSYNETFENLLQEFRDKAARDTSLVVHRVWHGVESLADKMDLNNIPYAGGAGLNTEKLCLLGTRGELLDEIVKWANNINGDVPRVFWLHGTAGSGKSSIAHTIANHFKQLKRLGSCFCFARDRKDDPRHEKIFTTIARDLAGQDAQLLGQLSAVVRDDLSLLHTPDLLQHWEKLIVGPAKALSEGMVGPIVIVIDALDESGDTDSRRRLLRILAENVANLPPHIRIFLTSRPLDDICNAFNDVAHIQRKSMDDIPQGSTERDILNFVSDQLSRVAIKSQDRKALARASGGLFEWARIACAHVRGDNNFEQITSINPYAQAAWTILSSALQKITGQVELDDSVLSLVVKMNDTYTFLISEGMDQIKGMETVVRRISQQTQECAYFIQAYSKNKHFWLRLLKNSFSEATERVQSYNETFENLLQEFRDKAARDTSLVVHRVWHGVESLAEKMDLNNIPYADGAGFNTEKLCLLGTRGELLDEIIHASLGPTPLALDSMSSVEANFEAVKVSLDRALQFLGDSDLTSSSSPSGFGTFLIDPDSIFSETMVFNAVAPYFTPSKSSEDITIHKPTALPVKIISSQVAAQVSALPPPSVSAGPPEGALAGPSGSVPAPPPPKLQGIRKVKVKKTAERKMLSKSIPSPMSTVSKPGTKSFTATAKAPSVSVVGLFSLVENLVNVTRFFPNLTPSAITALLQADQVAAHSPASASAVAGSKCPIMPSAPAPPAKKPKATT
ncbi:Vegetative incompatibility protein HET-E-1 [Leucoagaricus sp. SymC.cos]|nr:Vegetative incompatibility protein HET-E-1 [Leucoagaricus sp. SymC.cos]